MHLVLIISLHISKKEKEKKRENGYDDCWMWRKKNN